MANRWLIALACGWINLFVFSIFRSAGVIYLELIDRYDCTYQQAAWSLSLTGSVASITGIFSGFLTHYIATRSIILAGVLLCSLSIMSVYWATSIEYVTIAIGVFQGIGVGFITILLPVVLNVYFDEHKSIAFGISYAGATLGAFIFPVVIGHMFDAFKFNDTMALMGVLMLNAAAATFLLPMSRTNQQQQQQNIEMAAVREANNASFLARLRNTIWSDARMLWNRYFMLCTCTYTCFILQFVAFIIILPDVARDQRIDATDSKWLLSIFSASDFVGRLSPGLLTYMSVGHDQTIYIISISMLTLCMGVMLLLETWTQFVMLSVVCGLATGCQMVLSPAVLSDCLGRHNIAVAFGMCNFVSGVITLITRPLIIGLKDSYGSYHLLSYILLAVGLACTSLWLLDTIVSKGRARNSEPSLQA